MCWNGRTGTAPDHVQPVGPPEPDARQRERASVARIVLTAARTAQAILALALAAAALASRCRSVPILRISRVVADLDRAKRFYRDGLEFRCVGTCPGDPTLAALLGLSGVLMQEAVMRLGREEVALVRFDPTGSAHLLDSRSDDLWFQHLAIVVGDIDKAFRRVSAMAPQAISADGPVVLPPRNGGVTAWKFCDPDGHPLELIHLLPGTERDGVPQGRPGLCRRVPAGRGRQRVEQRRGRRPLHRARRHEAGRGEGAVPGVQPGVRWTQPGAAVPLHVPYAVRHLHQHKGRAATAKPASGAGRPCVPAGTSMSSPRACVRFPARAGPSQAGCQPGWGWRQTSKRRASLCATTAAPAKAAAQNAARCRLVNISQLPVRGWRLSKRPCAP